MQEFTCFNRKIWKCVIGKFFGRKGCLRCWIPKNSLQFRLEVLMSHGSINLHEFHYKGWHVWKTIKGEQYEISQIKFKEILTRNFHWNLRTSSSCKKRFFFFQIYLFLCQVFFISSSLGILVIYERFLSK